MSSYQKQEWKSQFVFRGSSVNFQMIYKPWILFISRTMLFMQAVHTTPSSFSLVRWTAWVTPVAMNLPSPPSLAICEFLIFKQLEWLCFPVAGHKLIPAGLHCLTPLAGSGAWLHWQMCWVPLPAPASPCMGQSCWHLSVPRHWDAQTSSADVRIIKHFCYR